MLRGEAARALLPFSRSERLYAEDFDLYQRLRPLGALARLDEPLVLYRQHAGGISKRYADTMRGAAMGVLAERHGDQPITALVQRMRCEGCGAKPEKVWLVAGQSEALPSSRGS